MRNNYEAFKEKVDINARRNNFIVLVDELPTSTLSYFRRRLKSDLPSVFKDLVFTTSKKASKLKLKNDGSLEREKEKFSLKKVTEKGKELSFSEADRNKMLGDIQLLRGEIFESRRIIDKLDKEKSRTEKQLEETSGVCLKFKSERDALQKSHDKIIEENMSLKSQIENSDAKMLILSGITGKCQSCGRESNGELIKDIIVFKCQCGRKEYKNITDSVLKLTF